MDQKIILLIADQIGVEPEDITTEDFLVDDLHMSPTEIAELKEKMVAGGLPEVEITQDTTVGDLLEHAENQKQL